MPEFGTQTLLQPVEDAKQKMADLAKDAVTKNSTAQENGSDSPATGQQDNTQDKQQPGQAKGQPKPAQQPALTSKGGAGQDGQTQEQTAAQQAALEEGMHHSSSFPFLPVLAVFLAAFLVFFLREYFKRQRQHQSAPEEDEASEEVRPIPLREALAAEAAKEAVTAETAAASTQDRILAEAAQVVQDRQSETPKEIAKPAAARAYHTGSHPIHQDDAAVVPEQEPLRPRPRPTKTEDGHFEVRV
jgi:hypothetical protein